MQNFDSVATQPSLRMTLGVEVALFRMTLEGRLFCACPCCFLDTPNAKNAAPSGAAEDYGYAF
jgi:hypothetical protein